MMRRVFLIVAGILAATAFADAAQRPNIIFMLVDDLGKEWINCYGGEGIETPNVDRLAETGMKFDCVYSMPQCIPTRMCYTTGQYPATNGWVDHWDPALWGRAYLDWTQYPTIGNILRKAGYKTAIAGKWQLTDTETMPESVYNLGYDEYFTWAPGHGRKEGEKNGRYWDPRFFHGAGGKHSTTWFEGKFGPDLEFEFVTDFIRRNRENPFYICYAFNLTHLPPTTTPLEPEAGKGLPAQERFIACHKAMVRYMDHIVGNLVAFLEEEGLRKNTVVIWTTDNGTAPRYSNFLDGRMVDGGKTKTVEPGVNAPFIVNAPGMVPAGVQTSALIDFTDMLPTFADFAGAELPAEHRFDGHSMKDLFTGKTEDSPRDWIVAMGGKPLSKIDESGRVVNQYYYRDRVIRNERYKLNINPAREPFELFDLTNDPGEENNLIDDPEHGEIQAWLLSMARKNFSKVDNDPRYSPISNPWDRPVNCLKPPLEDPDDPNRPLEVKPLVPPP